MNENRTPAGVAEALAATYSHPLYHPLAVLGVLMFLCSYPGFRRSAAPPGAKNLSPFRALKFRGLRPPISSFTVFRDSQIVDSKVVIFFFSLDGAGARG